MANPQEFSHITVTADEDDVVIQAGAVEETVVEEAPAAEVDDAREEDLESAPEDVSSASGCNAEVPASSEAASASSETTPTAPTAREKADAASFRETTLDDLESTRMSTTQKAIIVVAVLGVIAFVAWYLLAH